MATADQHLSFNIAYGMYLQRLGSRFYGRLDKLISFLVLLCGMAVVADYLNHFFLGVVVALLGCWQVVYTPGINSVAARNQQDKYSYLLEAFPTLTEEEVRKQLIELRHSDSDLPGCLEMPAVYAATKKLNANTDELPKLSLLQRFAMWFCG